jgi:hypothetical protein
MHRVPFFVSTSAEMWELNGAAIRRVEVDKDQ